MKERPWIREQYTILARWRRTDDKSFPPFRYLERRRRFTNEARCGTTRSVMREFESLEMGEKEREKKERKTRRDETRTSVWIIPQITIFRSNFHRARVCLAFFLFLFFLSVYLFLIAFVDTTINVRVTCVKPTLRKADVSGQRLPFSSYSNEMRERGREKRARGMKQGKSGQLIS